MTKKTQKKMRKALLLLACAALLVCITVGVTVAYLTDSKTVKNTFTVGKVGLTLTESKTDENGDETGDTLTGDETGTVGNEYKLMPGHEYTKDPAITINEGSELSFLFVKVVNGIVGIEDAENTIAAQMENNGWNSLGNNLFVYNVLVDGSTTEVDPIKVFDSFKVDDDKAAADLANYEGAEIEITAYAIQADGLRTIAGEAVETEDELAEAQAAFNAGFEG